MLNYYATSSALILFVELCSALFSYIASDLGDLPSFAQVTVDPSKLRESESTLHFSFVLTPLFIFLDHPIRNA